MVSRREFLRDLSSGYKPIAAETFPPEQPFPPGLNHAIVNGERLHRALDALARAAPGARRVVEFGVYPGTMLRLVGRHLGASIERVGVGLHFDERFRSDMAAEGIVLHEADLDPPPRIAAAALPFPSSAPLEDGSFDAAIATEVIEHLVQPLHMLREMARVVRPGGVIVLTTPNAARIGGLLKQLLGRSAQEPIRKSHVFTPPEDQWRGHVRLFSMDEMAVMLDATGFDVAARAWFSGAIDELMHRGLATRIWHVLRRAFFLVPAWRNDLLVVGRRRGA